VYTCSINPITNPNFVYVTPSRDNILKYIPLDRSIHVIIFSLTIKYGAASSVSIRDNLLKKRVFLKIFCRASWMADRPVSKPLLHTLKQYNIEKLGQISICCNNIRDTFIFLNHEMNLNLFRVLFCRLYHFVPALPKMSHNVKGSDHGV
jgi:hypothetical protein